MKYLFKNFYNHLYSSTGGYLSVLPDGFNVHPGDFFQIVNGEMLFLGNIFNPRIVDLFELDFEHDIPLNASRWKMEHGISRPYAGKGAGVNVAEQDFEFSRQVIRFKERGSFLFHGENPRMIRIKNWNEMQYELILKLTQTYYSFRSLYLVTESVTLDKWSLAIAGAEDAELELSNASNHLGLVDLFGHEASRTIQSRELDILMNEPNKKSNFFKVKKLTVRDDVSETFISELINQRRALNEWSTSFFPHDFFSHTKWSTDVLLSNAEGCVLDFLKGNQLNPNNVFDYFKWENGNLDDVNLLFNVYGG